jgi:kinetochore protein Mis13/DSN1
VHPKPTPKRGRPRKKQVDESSGVPVKGKSVELPSRKPTRGIEAHAESKSQSQSTKIARRNRESPEHQPEAKKSRKGRPPKARPEANGYQSPEQPPAGTKVALPVADTPVIQRNKELRGGKGDKGRRRSSLNMRGRRASSLIDSGTSNGRFWFAVACWWSKF